MINTKPYNDLPLLPFCFQDFMTSEVYKKFIKTNKELARLNGIYRSKFYILKNNW